MLEHCAGRALLRRENLHNGGLVLPSGDVKRGLAVGVLLLQELAAAGSGEQSAYGGLLALEGGLVQRRVAVVVGGADIKVGMSEEFLKNL